MYLLLCLTVISIHSTARVETVAIGLFADVVRISIHSTARVETGNVFKVWKYNKISIHSTARVETEFYVGNLHR